MEKNRPQDPITQQKLSALDQAMKSLADIAKRREKGEIVPYEPDEICGEQPCVDVGSFSIDDRQEEDVKRLEKIKGWAKEHKKRVIVTSIVAGIATMVVGGIVAVETLKKLKPDSDITDK